MERILNMVAFDCGNSSYRCVLAEYDGQKVKRTVIDQYPNAMIRVMDNYYWDFLSIFSNLKKSLKKVAKKAKIDSIGICTWGVDFALYSKEGQMISNPLSYRDDIGVEQFNKLSTKEKEELFYETGILCDKINSIYKFMGISQYYSSLLSITDKILMVPDVIAYMLTGEMQAEPSELSTSQFYDVKNKKISQKALSLANVDVGIFPKINKHGEIISCLKNEVLEEIGVDYDIPLVCVPSHDTASAILAVPSTQKEFAFLSTGTWALIGTELNEAIINKKVLKASLTNEIGAFDKITLLKNSAGMHLLQSIKKEKEVNENKKIEWDTITNIVKDYEGNIYIFNVNDIRFFNPKNMCNEINQYIKQRYNINKNLSFEAILTATHYSLAYSYKLALDEIESVLGKKFDYLYVVGGGGRNKKLNQITADITEKTLIVGDYESTSLGNVLCQIKYFNSTLSVEDLREISKKSIDIAIFKPKKSYHKLIDEYKLLN